MFLLILPELVFGTAALFFFFAAIGKLRRRVLQRAGFIAALAALCAAAWAYDRTGMLFHGVYTLDTLSQCFKLLVCAGLVLVMWCTAGFRGTREGFSAEYHLFLCLGCLGLCCMVSTTELITLIISMEVASYSFYALVPLRSRRAEREPLEAGIKYVFFGGAATAVTLYGMSYLFGLTQTTSLQKLAQSLPALLATEPLAVIGLVLFTAGICYKLALFPLHYWMPDVFVGAAHETACVLATLPKAAAVCLLLRFLAAAGAEAHRLVLVFSTLAVLSMTIGNLSALGQQDIKRLLAYSGVAHAGYLVVGMLALNRLGISAVIYYLSGYVVMTAGCFYVLYRLAPQGENITVEDLRGLYRRSPLLAATLAVAASGLAGIPPTIGFTGKFLMFAGALQREYYALVAIAVVNICIAAFYYLRLVRAAYSSVSGQVERVLLPRHATVCAAALIAAILLSGMLPQFFFEKILPAVPTLLR